MKIPKKKVKIGLDKKTSYTSLMLLKDLRKEIEKIYSIEELRGGTLSERALSKILGQHENYIRDWVKASIKRNPSYQIAIDKLDEFIYNLGSKFGKKSNEAIEFIEKYRKLNDIPYSNRSKIYNHHPNINLDYFKIINTKEKSYWLGYIYADGYITRKGNYLTHFGIELSKKDEILIDRFAEALGLNLEYKKYTIKKDKFQKKILTHCMLEFSNRKFVNNLKKHGVKEKKSRKLTLPEFGIRELNLAFLLGYFDGDGTEGKTTLTSASKEILEQIKETYNLPYKIRVIIENDNEYYRISLGGKLFNEMMENYDYSLDRKRKIFDIRRHKVHEQFKKSMTKSKLQDLVWKAPKSKLAEKYGVWRQDISKLCEEWNIETPPSGYWNQKKFLDKRKKYLL